MYDEPFYECQTITYDDIINELKLYIKSGDVNLIVKEALKEMGDPDLKKFSIKGYAVYLRPTLINKVKNVKNV